MFTDPSNIIIGIERMIEKNINIFNLLIKKYEPNSQLNVFRGKRKTLPESSFPSLEIEATNSTSRHLSTETMTSEYSFDFTLTISTNNDSMSLEYITAVTRLFTEMLSHPANRGFTIPYEKHWNTGSKQLCAAKIQFGHLDSVRYNANKEGTIRVSNWTWTASVLEGFPADWIEQDMIDEMVHHPHELPPVK